MWMLLHQFHLLTLADVAQKLLLLADKGADWPYGHIRMNDIGIITGDLPSQNACSCLHQLCMWQLL